MHMPVNPAQTDLAPIPNGAGAAAVLAAGIGSFLIGFFAELADKSTAIKNAMVFWKPTGPLSGVTTCAILLWIMAWAALHARWRGHTVQLARVNAIALALLALGVVLTFPPLADLI